ncbi:NUDIX hydrolase [Bosea sp. RCC_152_1]|uniref:NUDIX hydrolase n=1 Tax=Bosea sp. RCC_152_1 TaxID=3239228 RepID=UPI003523364B
MLKDRWIDVRADDCETASGHRLNPYYVLGYPDWVHVVAITPDRQLILVRQYRHAAGSDFLEVPGGVMEPADSDPTMTGVRELEEETGYIGSRARLISSLHANPAIQTNRVHICLVDDAKPHGRPSRDAGEDGMTVHLMPIPQVVAGLRGGLIGQSLHVASLLIGLMAAGLLDPGQPSG